MAAIPTTTLGRTGLEVSKLGYGAMELRRATAEGASPDAVARVAQRGARSWDHLH